jgi:hypothetical protein
MKKIVLIAAFLGASFGAPIATIAPAQAASSYPAHCVILPLLKAECREAIADATMVAPRVIVSTVETSAREASDVRWPVPMLWDCEPAPAGSGYLYDCN